MKSCDLIQKRRLQDLTSAFRLRHSETGARLRHRTGLGSRARPCRPSNRFQLQRVSPTPPLPAPSPLAASCARTPQPRPPARWAGPGLTGAEDSGSEATVGGTRGSCSRRRRRRGPRAASAARAAAMAEDSESAASQQSLELDDQDTCGIDGDNEEETEHAKG